MTYYDGFKNALSMLYEGRCTIESYVASQDENGITKGTWQVVIQDTPCHLAFLENKEASEGERSIGAVQARLFLYSALEVKAGARVSVIQHGSTYQFKHSGVSARFSTHQEIDLVGEIYV